MLALDTLEVEFFGKASHAGMAPWNGINALDAIMQGFDNVALMRQQSLITDRFAFSKYCFLSLKSITNENVLPDFTVLLLTVVNLLMLSQLMPPLVTMLVPSPEIN